MFHSHVSTAPATIPQRHKQAQVSTTPETPSGTTRLNQATHDFDQTKPMLAKSLRYSS